MNKDFALKLCCYNLHLEDIEKSTLFILLLIAKHETGEISNEMFDREGLARRIGIHKRCFSKTITRLIRKKYILDGTSKGSRQRLFVNISKLLAEKEESDAYIGRMIR